MIITEFYTLSMVTDRLLGMQMQGRLILTEGQQTGIPFGLNTAHQLSEATPQARAFCLLT